MGLMVLTVDPATRRGGELTASQTQPNRNPDGTFTKGSELAKELGSIGGHVAHEQQLEKDGVRLHSSVLQLH